MPSSILLALVLVTAPAMLQANDTFLSYYEATADFSLPEVPRIQQHFAELDALFATVDTSVLTAEQRCERDANLARLRAYSARGRFPLNETDQLIVPQFIDRVGTACAVGHLMIESGAGDLARRIAAQKNDIFVHELAAWPEAVAWVQQSGLTLEECGMIQPGYCGQPGPFYDDMVAEPWGTGVRLTWTNVYGTSSQGVCIKRPGAFWNLDNQATELYDPDAPLGTTTYQIHPGCDPFGILSQFFEITLENMPYLRGDCSPDGAIDIADGVALLSFLFSGGPATTCADACDMNNDSNHDIADAVYVFNYLLLEGPEPVAPFPACGPVYTMGCYAYDECP